MIDLKFLKENLPAVEQNIRNRNIQADAALVALGAGLGGLALAVFAGAWLAALISGGRVGGGVGDWLGVATRLVTNPGDPGAAGGPLASGLPGPVPYWLCTAVTVAGRRHSLGVDGSSERTDSSARSGQQNFTPHLAGPSQPFSALTWSPPAST